MNIQEFQKKYLNIYHSHRAIGVKNKLLMLLLVIPALIVMYFDITGMYYVKHWSRFVSYNQLVMIILGTGLLVILTILTIKSFAFIEARKVDSYKFYFKKELFDNIKSGIPEIDDYVLHHTIHPKIFCNSGLFKLKFSDYTGDDWIRGHIGEITFEMCELHVFNLLNKLFHGFFIRIRLNSNPVNVTDNLLKNKDCISDFEKNYRAKVSTSERGSEIYIAIRMAGRFFEGDSPQMIKSVNKNVIMLRDIVGIIRIISGAPTKVVNDSNVRQIMN